LVDETKLEALDIFPWNENFETGIEEIDEQHKTLIMLLNKLANSLTQDETFEIEETFAELAEYAKYHFESEEAIWKKYIHEQSLIDEHKDSHDSFLPEVIKIKEENSHKSIHEIIEEILLFLIRWLAFHIIDEDKRLALVIKSIQEGKEINEAKFISNHKMSGSMKVLIEAILSMYDNLSLKAIKLIRERKARIKAQKELRAINKKLEELSITDQLTELYNRRFFEDTFDIELKKAKRNKTILNVILFDIDYFKKLNDTYGHSMGDKALVCVAKCVKEVCKRPNDFAFRIGGEEFTILITNEDFGNAYQLAQILQKEIDKLQIPNKNSEVSEFLTISAGIVELLPQEKDSIESIMKLADERLYKAKELGRNTIVKD